MKRFLLACAAVVFGCAGCHGSSTSATTQATAAPTGSDAALLPLSDKYGFVRMDDLMRVHPQAAQLAAINSQLTELQAQIGAPQSARDLASIRTTQAALQQQLQDAAAKAQALLRDQGVALENEERTQVQTLIAQESGAARSQNGAAFASHGQPDLAAAITAQNQTYANRLEAEKQHAIQVLATSVNERDTRIYKTKEDQLQQQESDDAIKLAQADSADRVNLQAKASDLTLGPDQKHEIADGLSALDAKEEAQRKLERTADAETLLRLHEKLQSDSQREFNSQVAEIRNANEAHLLARGLITRAQAQASVTPLPMPTQPGYNPALAAQIKAVHQRFQERFNADSRASVASFKATRTQLQSRFNQVATAHVSSQNALGRQIQLLEHQRDELITKMTSQIQTKTVSVAEHASIDVVMTNVLAQSNAIDLTNDVARQLKK